MKKIHLTFVVIVLLSLSVNLAYSQNVGEQAPDFEVTTLSGSTFKLSDQLGDLVVIYFFGNGCPFCRETAPWLESNIYQEYKDDSFAMIGIDTWNHNSTVTSVNSFKSFTGVTFDLVVQGGSIKDLYNTTYDRVIVVDKDGKIVHKGTTAVENDKSNISSAVMNNIPGVSPVDNMLEDHPNEIIVEAGSYRAIINLNVQTTDIVTVNLYDISGKHSKQLFNEFLSPDVYQKTVELNDLQTGIYLYHINGAGISKAGKIAIF